MINLTERTIPERTRLKLEEIVRNKIFESYNAHKHVLDIIGKSENRTEDQIKEQRDRLNQEEIADYEIIIKNSGTQGATSLIRNGGIYDITTCVLKTDGTLQEKSFRAKKFTDRRMYQATINFQDELRIASDEGDLNGELEPDGTGQPGIARNHSLPIGAYALSMNATDDAEMIILEPLVTPAVRLTDYIRELQKMESPGKRKRLVEDITKKAIYVTTIASSYITPAEDMSEFKEYNELFGVTNPLEQFIKKYALRNQPELEKRLFDASGNLDRQAMNQIPAFQRLVSAYEQEFLPAYHKRNLHMVNRDNHTGNLLIDDSHVDESSGTHDKAMFILTDFDSMYFDLLEEPIAELILTSGIEDQKTMERIVSKAYDYARHDINVTRNQFIKSFNTKLTEKYLIRAGRFWQMSKKFGGVPEQYEGQPTEEQNTSLNFFELACRAYTIALGRMADAGMRKTKRAVESFNEKYMGLCKVNERANPEYGFHNTLCSIAEAA